MPVRVRYPRPGGGYSRPYDEDNDGPVTIPISEEEVLADYADLLLPELRNYREAYTDADLARTTETVREAMAAFLRRHAEDDRNTRFDGEVVVAQTSDVLYSVDPRNVLDRPGWRLDLEHTFRSHGRPETEVILNRPMRGAISLPDEMWNKLGLHPEAYVDFASQGLNCVVQQIAVAFNVRVNPRPSEAGQRGPKQREEKREQLDMDDILWHLDLVFEELYPGHYVGDKGERVEPKRCAEQLPNAEAHAEALRRFAEAWKEQWKQGSRVSKRCTFEYLLTKAANKGNTERNFGFKAKEFHDALKESWPLRSPTIGATTPRRSPTGSGAGVRSARTRA
jgi:hypothetical protein